MFEKYKHSQRRLPKIIKTKIVISQYKHNLAKCNIQECKMGLTGLHDSLVHGLVSFSSSSETQGQIAEAKESQNGRKKMAMKKNIVGREEPLGTRFQTAEVILNSDWCQKLFVFFWPIRGQQAVRSFRVFLHGNHLIAILALVRLARFCSRRKVSITTQNIQGIVRNIGGEILWTFRRYWYSSVFPSVRDLFKDVLTDSMHLIK